MAKVFTFGKIKQPEKEQKNDDSGVVVTDIVNDYIDKSLETVAQLRQENDELKKKLNQLAKLLDRNEDELLTKNTSIQGYNETIEHLSAKVVELTEANLELEEIQVQEKIIVEPPKVIIKTPPGFKPAITEETIAQMRVFAKSILHKKGTIKFYEQVGIKFGISTGSAYKYTKDIYQGIQTNE